MTARATLGAVLASVAIAVFAPAEARAASPPRDPAEVVATLHAKDKAKVDDVLLYLAGVGAPGADRGTTEALLRALLDRLGDDAHAEAAATAIATTWHRATAFADDDGLRALVRTAAGKMGKRLAARRAKTPVSLVQAQALRRLGPLAAPAVDDLVAYARGVAARAAAQGRDAMADSAASIAIDALAAIGKGASRALPALRALSSSDDARLAEAAQRAVRAIEEAAR